MRKSIFALCTIALIATIAMTGCVHRRPPPGLHAVFEPLEPCCPYTPPPPPLPRSYVGNARAKRSLPPHAGTVNIPSVNGLGGTLRFSRSDAPPAMMVEIHHGIDLSPGSPETVDLFFTRDAHFTSPALGLRLRLPPTSPTQLVAAFGANPGAVDLPVTLRWRPCDDVAELETGALSVVAGEQYTLTLYDPRPFASNLPRETCPLRKRGG